MDIEPIAYFHSPFNSKFGIPKQSGLVDEIEGVIEFVPRYRVPDALRGIEDFDYIWIIWGFSANRHVPTSLLVRPPLLGGNEKMGVFATRSPYRPNLLGLSSVRIKHIDINAPHGPIITVAGADLMEGTPIYDIKPYISYADSHPEAKGGFVDKHIIQRLKVDIPNRFHSMFTSTQLQTLYKVLELDPRPHYHKSRQKEYGMAYGNYDIHFVLDGDVLLVTNVIQM